VKEKKPGRVLINVKIQPKSRKRSIERIGLDEYKVRVLAPPAKGEANKEVIQIIASYFDIPPSRVSILKGLASRNKVVAIHLGDKRILGKNT